MDFLKELRSLVQATPHSGIHSKNAENCAYGDYLYRCKNTYVSYFLTDAEDCYYSEYLSKTRDCIDCAYTMASELCYECVDCSYLYDCSYLQDCHNCSECDFSLDCINCKNCFGSFGLRQQQFCIFNKAYSEEVYRERIAEFKKTPFPKILAILKPEFDKHPRLYARLLKGGEHCYGDYIYFSKNCFHCFNVRNVEQGAYLTDICQPEKVTNNSFDCTWCDGLDTCYECHNCSNCLNCNFLDHCASCTDTEYSMYCYNCRNCFGCIYLHNKQYCILNKQCTRNEYFFALEKIKHKMKEEKSYGKALSEII